MSRQDIDSRVLTDSELFEIVERDMQRKRLREQGEIGIDTGKFAKVMSFYNDWYDNDRYERIARISGNCSEFLNMVTDAALELSSLALGTRLYTGAMARLFSEVIRLENNSEDYHGLLDAVTNHLERFS